MKTYALIMQAVTELIVTVVALIFIGQWADKHFQTGSRYVAIGAILGSGLGFVRLIMRLSKLGGEDQPPPPEQKL